MTTMQNLTIRQIETLCHEARAAGDDKTVADCMSVLCSVSPDRHVAALRRIVSVIRNAEAQ